ncbi:phosphotransferase [Marinilactibacillus sp. 15R]|uniref:Thiamine kinase n=1 Tax=Marinilactibacillus piezotolerans TaxID=258723 RepID=A0A1I4BUS3_9LACT|nr:MULTISPECIES: phosphotransferase family protein [Marinilactibacillus]API89094.1 phosphotransferase [Marinilactibacillus sp. 15R]SFK72544.1 Thiamine kinase [Marinilactibacillus piezotolerans]
MELERETGWKLHPIGGDTGQAYMGTKDEEKLFLKRNSSPFLAALSLEGISPKLIWTKRIGNGDVLTAQEWCNGRNLFKDEMHSSRVAKILKKVHQSESLKRMLQRVGGRSIHPKDLLTEYKSGLAKDLAEHPQLKKAYKWLVDTKLEIIKDSEISVCHGDVSRKNWLLSEEDQLYLVDWDSAILADLAYDIGQLFSRYIEKKQWNDWLNEYDHEISESFLKRINWYVIMTLLMDVKEAHRKGQFIKMNNAIVKIDQLMSN